VHEVPLAKRALLTLDDEQRFAGQHEEVLLGVLPVVDRHRLAGFETCEVDAELQEIRRALEACALELAEHAAALALPPVRLARVEDEPALSLRNKAVFCGHELRLRDHQSVILPRCVRVGASTRRRERPRTVRDPRRSARIPTAG
jgi:hypothetical protein